MRLLALLFSLLFLLPLQGFSQSQQEDECWDYVYMKNGSVFRGNITKLEQGGQIAITTWNGHHVFFDETSVRKIIQKCKDEKQVKVQKERTYTFKERGIYHHFRLGTLNGIDYYSDFTQGFLFQHASGYQFNKNIGVGIGIGAERFILFDRDSNTFPIFVEARGYLLSERFTPFYALGVGYSLVDNRNNTENWGFEDTYTGGPMLQALFGYRMGNHFTLQCGLRYQKKTRDWISTNNGTYGRDKILFRRIEIGFGFII